MRYLWWSLPFLLLLLGSYLWMGRSGEEGPTVQVDRGPVEQVLWLPGWIEPVGGIVDVSTPLRGIVTALQVRVGQKVQVGDILLTLEGEEAAAQVAQGRAAVSQAEANLKALEALFRDMDRVNAEAAQKAATEATQRAAQKAAQRASTEAERRSAAPEARPLPSAPTPSGEVFESESPAARGSAPSGRPSGASNSDGAGSPPAPFAELESEARALLQQLNPGLLPTLLRSSEGRREALSSARAAVEVARAQLAQALSYEGKTVLRAPITGTVVTIGVDVGEQAGGLMPTPLVSLADLTHLQVRLEIDEADLNRVQVGMPGFIRTAATGGERFTGKVLEVAPELGRRKVPLDDPRARIDIRVLEAVLSLDQPGAFRISQRVEAGLILSQAESTLRAPVGAVYHHGGVPVVKLASGLGFREQPVKLGRTDHAFVELLEGVQEGDVLHLDPAFNNP
ncbi:MAG: efflux RND transporter periplasmic adaptor subunit [Myxococcota bacterium]